MTVATVDSVPLAEVEARAELDARSPLVRWSREAAAAAAVAVSLAKTPFVPDSLRDKLDRGDVTAANITAAILTGQEIGLQPMAAMRSIDVIKGTPGMRALALRALVLSQGHDMWLVESTKTRAIVRGQRKGSDHVQESTWTLDRAKELHLLGNYNWTKQPANMLVARATAECARLVAPDAMLGIPYSIEELDDGADVDTATTAAATAAAETSTTRRVSRKPKAPVERAEAPAPELPADDATVGAVGPSDEPVMESSPELPEGPTDEPSESEPVAPTGPPISPAQLRKLHTMFSNVGISAERETCLALATEVAGRPITTSKDLTVGEASNLIDALESGTWRGLLGMDDEGGAAE